MNSMMKEKVKAIAKREKNGLVATCEKCGKRGGPDLVPYKVEYWPDFQSGRSGRIAYRCEACKTSL